MTADRPMRASDSDRDRVVEILREQTAQGRLTFEEFGERTDRAYVARTWDELGELTEDLPVRVDFLAGANGAGGRPEPTRPVKRAFGPATVRPQTLLLPAIVSAVLVGIVAAGAWAALPLVLIAACCAAGSRGRGGGGKACGTRVTPVSPPATGRLHRDRR